MQKEEWDAEAKKQVTKRRVGDGQQGRGAVDAQQERHHARAVRGVLQADQLRQRGAAGLHAQPRRGPQRVHAAALHPGQGAVRPVEPRQARRREALRQARLHHGRRRGADAGLPALRQGRDRQRRPAAQREPRAAAGKPRREGDPRGLDQARAGDAGGLADSEDAAETRQVRRVLEGLRRGAEGRRRRGPRQPRAPGQAAALRVDARRRRRLVRRLRGAHEGRPGGDLLHHRRHAGRGEEQPAARDLPQEGHRGAAADRPRRRVDALPPVRVRRQAAAERGQGRGRPGQAAGRGREEAGRGGRRRRSSRCSSG